MKDKLVDADRGERQDEDRGDDNDVIQPVAAREHRTLPHRPGTIARLCGIESFDNANKPLDAGATRRLPFGVPHM